MQTIDNGSGQNTSIDAAADGLAIVEMQRRLTRIAWVL